MKAQTFRQRSRWQMALRLFGFHRHNASTSQPPCRAWDLFMLHGLLAKAVLLSVSFLEVFRPGLPSQISVRLVKPGGQAPTSQDRSCCKERWELSLQGFYTARLDGLGFLLGFRPGT